MAFLFKNKKNQDRGLTSRDGPPGSLTSTPSAASRVARDEKSSIPRSTPTGSVNSFDNEVGRGSPEQVYGPRRATTADLGQVAQSTPMMQPFPMQQSQPGSDLQLRNPPQPSSSNASLYPWSMRRLTYTSSQPSPFPRYGAAVNSAASKEGDLYIMGGLINSSTVKGDLWLIEAGGSMACYPLATTAEGPGPRVGHSSLLVGNAFIVFGGDTKIDESDVLDETLYLLNTSTRHWSRALPAGVRPSGRYGHSLNLLGSKIYIFGGQIEGFFMNDLSAFDLNQLQLSNNRWEMLFQNSESGAAAQGSQPPARTNHSVVTFNDKMYLFGGTNGFQWFNDVWCYDPATNTWSQLECIGYIPVPREGHAAAIVDDVMYIFGGRTEEGADLGDLAAFRISSRRWYTFQNMGPSPSPRSGHSMTTVGKSVVVVGGEPSSASTAVNDLTAAYLLDTTKIRYPTSDSQGTSQKVSGARRPSTSDGLGSQVTQRLAPSREGSQEGKRLAAVREAGTDSPTPLNGLRPPNDGSSGQPPLSNGIAKLTRSAPSPAPTSSPQTQAGKPTVNTAVARVRNASIERVERNVSPSSSQNQSPVTRDSAKEITEGAAVQNGSRTPPQQQAPLQQTAKTLPQLDTSLRDAPKPALSRQARDTSLEPATKPPTTRPASPPPPSRQNSNPLSRRSSGRNSQTVALLKELDSARNRNAWYASELELARKAGYTPNSSMSPVLDSRTAETFDEDDKPLIEALLAMKQELANVQNSVDKQAVIAAKQIAEAEKQRDAAIQEAVYAKAKLAAHTGGTGSKYQLDDSGDHAERASEMSRKLATALNTHKDLQAQLERTKSDHEAERRARKLADDTTSAAQKRTMELESYKQQTASELERLKAELHRAQREAREHAVASADAVAAAQLLRLDKDDLQRKYDDTRRTSEAGDSFRSLRDALAASTDMRSLLERKLDEEKVHREKVETKLLNLKAEHESQTAELVSTTQRLRDAEELAEQHANEAKAHRDAVMSGLDQMALSEANKPGQDDSERVAALQSQLSTANALVRKYQQEVDAAADRLRAAEERIAGLEAYQEQSSREGVTIRRQLQAALRETQSLQAGNSELKNQLASQQLETNAMAVQHNTLKDILSERGISPTSAPRQRNTGSPRGTSPEQARLRDLEQQLAASHAAHEETKQSFALQHQDSESTYMEKLSQLENDYQSAVHYVKGTEKMLKQLKEQLSRYKTENTRLKTELEEMEESKTSTSAAASARDAGPAEWETERDGLHQKIQDAETATARLKQQAQSVQQELEAAQRDRDTAVKTNEDNARRLGASRRDLEQLQEENAQLERRAQDAEQKVSLLLDQVETSVGNYRRRSRQVASVGSDTLAGAAGAGAGAAAGGAQAGHSGVGHGGAVGGGAAGGANGLGHSRQESSEAESLYGGLGDARNSTALDNLANELETLRSHWEATNKSYRLSNTFDFESHVRSGSGGGGVGARGGAAGGNATAGGSGAGGDGAAPGATLGLSESLADWRKRLDDGHGE